MRALVLRVRALPNGNDHGTGRRVNNESANYEKPARRQPAATRQRPAAENRAGRRTRSLSSVDRSTVLPLIAPVLLGGFLTLLAAPWSVPFSLFSSFYFFVSRVVFIFRFRKGRFLRLLFVAYEVRKWSQCVDTTDTSRHFRAICNHEALSFYITFFRESAVSVMLTKFFLQPLWAACGTGSVGNRAHLEVRVPLLNELPIYHYRKFRVLGYMSLL